MTIPTISAVFLVIYLVAVFAGVLALLRLRRENEALRERIEALERERDLQRGVEKLGRANSEPGS